MRGKNDLAILPLVCAVILFMGWPTPAQAQRYRPGVRSVRPVVFVNGGFYYPPLFGFYPFYPWYPFPFGGYPPYGFYGAAYDTSALRVQVTPRETEVYVDGYLAGVADDFDGVFQRLRLPPGAHDIELHLDGFRSLRQTLYLTPGSTYKIRHTMVPLGPGEANERRPVPRPTPAAPPSPNTPAAMASRTPADASRFGTLSIRVQPANADVLIDGDRWRGPETQDALVVLSPKGSTGSTSRKTAITSSPQKYTCVAARQPLSTSACRRSSGGS